MNLTILDLSYKWTSTVLVLCDWPAPVSLISSRFIFVVAKDKLSFFSKAE